MLRPSISTSSLPPKKPLKPRASGDAPLVAVDLGHVQAGHGAQQVRQGGGAEALDVLPPQHGGGSGSLGQFGGMLEHGADFRTQQLFDGKGGQAGQLGRHGLIPGRTGRFLEQTGGAARSQRQQHRRRALKGMHTTPERFLLFDALWQGAPRPLFMKVDFIGLKPQGKRIDCIYAEKPALGHTAFPLRQEALTKVTICFPGRPKGRA